MPQKFLAHLEEMRRLREDLERVKTQAALLQVQLTNQIESIEQEIERDRSPARSRIRRTRAGVRSGP